MFTLSFSKQTAIIFLNNFNLFCFLKEARRVLCEVRNESYVQYVLILSNKWRWDLNAFSLEGRGRYLH